ncbi:putative quinol monooxygenase [Streptomyces mobaraensis]|uniref:Antibiotic biosynthesis monooxygenase n=1 Tax=Streptomyces mobaraensis TaxID=35621 RepID=A0A5N5VZ04_STRMB|nr:putative quinol monooxygenase [Streptomyces mobaraensis]KAB7834125.1 antibiotic biosynthesis monooxygenase [Streptomyces mobaraensis]
MTLFVVAECLAAPGKEDRLRTALEAMIEPSLDEPGCLAYRPYADPNDPARMVIVEQWTSQEALDEHFATPHFRHVVEVLDEILAEPLTVRRLVPAPAGGPAA